MAEGKHGRAWLMSVRKSKTTFQPQVREQIFMAFSWQFM